MLRDPRVSVTVIDSADPENYVGLHVLRLAGATGSAAALRQDN
jgi:hypothetical protein